MAFFPFSSVKVITSRSNPSSPERANVPTVSLTLSVVEVSNFLALKAAETLGPGMVQKMLKTGLVRVLLVLPEVGRGRRVPGGTPCDHVVDVPQHVHGALFFFRI